MRSLYRVFAALMIPVLMTPVSFAVSVPTPERAFIEGMLSLSARSSLSRKERAARLTRLTEEYVMQANPSTMHEDYARTMVEMNIWSETAAQEFARQALELKAEARTLRNKSPEAIRKRVNQWVSESFRYAPAGAQFSCEAHFGLLLGFGAGQIIMVTAHLITDGGIINPNAATAQAITWFAFYSTFLALFIKNCAD